MEHLVLFLKNLQIEPFLKLHIFLPNSLPGRMEFYIITFLCKNNNIELLVIWVFHHSFLSSLRSNQSGNDFASQVARNTYFSFKKISQRSRSEQKLLTSVLGAYLQYIFHCNGIQHIFNSGFRYSKHCLSYSGVSKTGFILGGWVGIAQV